jgi:hypothetical protein
MRHLTGAPADDVAAERAKVATEGWGARLLALQGADGQWDGGALFPAGWDGTGGQPWSATEPTLTLLREFGIDPGRAEVQRAVEQVRDGCRWEHDGQPFFDGEVEACINGRTLAIGAYFGADVDALCSGLLGEQLEDGGWNCETEQGSTVSSFHSTICVLEGLLEYEGSGGSLRVTEARQRGEEYLLERQLFRSKRTGEVIRDSWEEFAWPPQWHYDVLRGLDHFRAVGGRPDERLRAAVEVLRSKQTDDGRWLMDQVYGGEVHFAFEPEAEPSRWNTLRALRVLRWYDAEPHVAG